MIFFVGKMADYVHLERKGNKNMLYLAVGFYEK